MKADPIAAANDPEQTIAGANYRFLLAQLSISVPEKPTRVLLKALEEAAGQIVHDASRKYLLSHARKILASQHPVRIPPALKEPARGTEPTGRTIGKIS